MKKFAYRKLAIRKNLNANLHRPFGCQRMCRKFVMKSFMIFQKKNYLLIAVTAIDEDMK
jgi:hypothetical protein